MKTKTEEALHSSGYARIQQRDRIGSTSAEGFAARRAMETNRQMVQNYKDSQVGAARNGGEGLSGYNAEADAAARAAIQERFSSKASERGGGAFGGSEKGSAGSFARNGGAHGAGSPPSWRNPSISR